MNSNIKKLLNKISKLGSKMQRNEREKRGVDPKDKKEYNRLSREFFKNVTPRRKPPPPPKSKKPSPPPKNKKNK